MSANAVEGPTIDLKPVTWKHPACEIELTLVSADGTPISSYHRQLRCVPRELLDKKTRGFLDDPFND